MPRKINRAITMTESRWRLQILRADGVEGASIVDREQTFTNEDTAFRAFDALLPSIPKRLQMRAAGKSRYVTIESEGCGVPTLADEVETDEHGRASLVGRHTFKASPCWVDVCEACGEAESHENHGAP